MPALSYRDAVDKLMSLADFERKSRANEPPDFHLRRMGILLADLGDPHLAIPAVHVAGSKGKGSTAALITSGLAAHGLSVGLYTSPHLHHVRERIRVGDEPVSESRFAHLIEELWPLVDGIERRGDSGQVSVFELLTAMAFQEFRSRKLEFQVIEVGLGGRLDATNLLQPEVCVITPIGLDHVAVLGDTIPQIAFEKAGIIKERTPVVTGKQPAEALKVIREVAQQRRAPLTRSLDRVQLVQASRSQSHLGAQHVALRGSRGEYDMELPLLGSHQVENARTAVAALEVLAERGWTIDPPRVSAGLSRVQWPARMQVLAERDPRIVVDGAHNPDAAAALARAVQDHLAPSGRVLLIFGGSGGHDFSATAREFQDLNPVIIVTRSRHPKSQDPAAVKGQLVRDNMTVAVVTADTAEALTIARRMAEPGDLILATGSLFIAAEIIEHVKGIPPEHYPNLSAPSRSTTIHTP